MDMQQKPRKQRDVNEPELNKYNEERTKTNTHNLGNVLTWSHGMDYSQYVE